MVSSSLRIESVEERHLGDLDVLFGSDKVTDNCWCAWFVTSVKDFHLAGRDGNRRRFVAALGEEPHPIGLVAYDGGDPVGWCALGPRSRFTRAVKTPTMKQRKGHDHEVWLVPCFWVHPNHRHSGVAAALLQAAVTESFECGAAAIEGFPLSGNKRRSGGSDHMTGIEPLFHGVGFAVDHRPSTNRVIMRLKNSSDRQERPSV